MDISRRVLLAAPAGIVTAAAASKTYRVYFGAYTRAGGKGIATSSFDPSTGKLSAPELAAEIGNPSFLAIHPKGTHLYSVGEAGEGIVAAFAIQADGKLNKLNQKPTRGSSPCHLALDRTNRMLIVVNYATGSTISYRLNADLSLGDEGSFVEHKGSSVNAQRQTSPHAHSVNISKNNKWAVVADLGTDEYIVYAIEPATGKIARNGAAKAKPGAGPRHFHFHPSYKFAYGVNELGSSVTAFSWNERAGELSELHTVSTLPSDFAGQSTCAEVLVHPNGRFVYASNRGHNSIASFSVDSTGKLTPVERTPSGGRIPRNFRIDPTGKWLLAANQESSNVCVFRLDPLTGLLTPFGEPVSLSMPVCIRFLDT